MDFITYTLSVLIAFLGILAGSYLANFAPEEVHSIKKYLPLAQMLAIVLLFFIIFSFFPFFIATTLLILTFSFLRLFWHKQNVNVLDYSVFGVIFPLTSLVIVAHYYVTILLFIFGLFSGALFYVLHTKSKKKTDFNVAHHKHRGRVYSHDEILVKLFGTYVFFFLLSISSYLVSTLFLSFIG